MDALTQMPARFSAGSTLTYRRTLLNLPSSSYGWGLKLLLAGHSTANATASVDSSGAYVVTLSATATDALTPGAYRWIERIIETSPGTQVFDIARGVVIVDPDLATATTDSALSHAEKMLALIEAALEGRLPRDQESVQINGTAVVHIPVPELRTLRLAYLAEVEFQRSPNAAIGSVEINFGPPRLPVIPGWPLFPPGGTS